MIEFAEKTGKSSYENLPGPRPWEMTTSEEKEKYLKRAYAQVETNIINRDRRKEEEENRIKLEMDKIKEKLRNSQNLKESDDSE
jgi:hypothetical protein